MESGQNLKRRMKSVANIGQITKAMELVAATKMRRSQELALNSRPYAYTALALLGILSDLKDVPIPALFEKRPVEHTVFLLMTSDRGLAGSFNGAVIRQFERYLKDNHIDLADPQNRFIAIGQKAKSYLERRKANVVASFTRMGDMSDLIEAEPIADFLIDGYVRHDFDRVLAFFTTFVTALRQDSVIREFLPVSYEAIRQSVEETIPRAGRYADYAKSETLMDGDEKEYLIEPSPRGVLEELAPKLLKIRLYHAILEANASEHSARRVAMKNASDNASELSENLTMVYNKSRQAAITAQIIEIVSGVQSMQ
jgi:F-type H+-transporting ATPase subunit gamma